MGPAARSVTTRDGTVMNRPNRALRAARERVTSGRLPGCSLSRDELACRVNSWLLRETGGRFALDERAIGRWERGDVALPSAHYRAALRAVLQVDRDAELGFGNPPPSGAPVGAGRASGEPPTVEAIRAMATSVHVADRRLGGGHLYRSVMDYLQDDVARALFAPGSGARVYAAAASLTEIAGWMAHDSGRDVDARTHFHGAYRFSLAAGSVTLAANMCASMSHLAIQVGEQAEALRIADVGLDRASCLDGIARVTARLHAMRATALAHHGDRRGCLAALGRAERSLSGSDDDEHAQWSAHFDEGSFAAEAARALHQLADLDPAERHARIVLDLRCGDRVRARAFGRLTLAGILLDGDAPDEAAEMGRQVARIAPELSSARVRSQLGELALAVRVAAPTDTTTAFLTEVAALDRRRTEEATESWPM